MKNIEILFSGLPTHIFEVLNRLHIFSMHDLHSIFFHTRNEGREVLLNIFTEAGLTTEDVSIILTTLEMAHQLLVNHISSVKQKGTVLPTTLYR